MNPSKKIIVFILGGWAQKGADGAWHMVGFEENADEVSGFGGYLRVLAAKHLLDEHPDYLLVPSGSRGKFEGVAGVPTIAELMRQELLRLGVPDEKIVKEERGGNTYQQLKELKKMIADLDAAQAIIVSNRYHLPRVKAFIGTDEQLSDLLQAGAIRLQECEAVVTRHGSAKQQEIDKAYQSQKMKNIIAAEEKGIGEIKAGTYSIIK